MNDTTCNGIRYVIQEGDTLYKISRTYRVPLALILRANPYVDVYNLQVGDELCIPMTTGEPIKPGKPEKPERPPAGPQKMIYVVRPGDTMESVLKRFGMKLEDFLKYNGLDAIFLQPGTTLEVPGVCMLKEQKEEETEL